MDRYKTKARFHHPMRERGFTGYRMANITFITTFQQYHDYPENIENLK